MPRKWEKSKCLLLGPGGAMVLFLTVGFTLLSDHGKGGPPFEPLILIGGGLAALLSCLRSGFTIDGQQRTLIKWLALTPPFLKEPRITLRTREISLRSCQEVHVTYEKQRIHSEKSSRTIIVYPVRIDGRLLVEAPKKVHEARILAEQLSKLLNLDVHDSSTGELIVRKAGTMDMSFRSRMRTEVGNIPLPHVPEYKRIEIDRYPGGVKITMPGALTLEALSVLAAAAMAGLILLGPRWWLFGLIYPTLLVVAAALSTGTAIAIVTPRELIFERRLFGVRFRKSIDANALEEITEFHIPQRTPGFVVQNVITAISDEKRMSLHTPLPEIEARYLFAHIKKALCESR